MQSRAGDGVPVSQQHANASGANAEGATQGRSCHPAQVEEEEDVQNMNDGEDGEANDVLCESLVALLKVSLE